MYDSSAACTKFYIKTHQEKIVCILYCGNISVIRISAKVCNDILTTRRNVLYV